MTLHTDQPGLQLYSFNAPRAPLLGKAGQFYRARSAIALEPQGFPDAPNQPLFPNTILRPGEVYRAISVYAFDVTA
jgi:aldose 1-epimerase